MSLGTYMGRMVVSAGGGTFAAVGNTMPDINSGLTAGEVANGSRWNQAFVYKAQSKATATVEAPWGSGSSTIADTGDPPAVKTVTFAWPVGGVTFGSALLESFTVSGKANSFVTVQGAFTNQGDPTAGGSGAGVTSTNPPLFKDLSASTLGGAGSHLESFDATFNNGLIAFYGNSGSSYPSEYIPGTIKASGKFVSEFTGNAELSSLLGNCPATGTMSFSGGGACGTGSFSVNCQHVYYASWRINQSMTAATTEEIAFQMISTDGSAVMTVG